MRYAIALLTAACAAVVLGIALAFACGGLSALPAALALLGGVAAGAFAYRQMPRNDRPESAPHPVEWLVLGIFALVSFRAFFWLVWVWNGDLHILSPNNLGDLALHFDYIRYLASGVPFWPDNPIFTGETLKYPIGADFFNSLLLDCGVPLERGLVWVGIFSSALTAAALWRWGRGFAIAAFLFGGGLAGFALLRDPGLIGHGPLPDFQANATWKNLFLALFVTQRGLLFALPAGLFLLDHWRTRYLRAGRGFLPDWVALLLYASLPLFSVHSFLFLSIALLGMFVFARDSSARRESFRFAAIAFLPATLCAALVTGGFSAGSGVHWEPGWLQDSEEGVGPWWFWLRNFGLYLVLWAVLTVVAAIRGPREARAIVLPASAMFLACCFISFAPWPWDNTKILLWCWLAVAPCLWTEFLQPMHFAVRAAVCFVLFFTGAVSLVAGLDRRHGYTLADFTLVQRTEGAVRNLDPNARFACAPEYWHPLILIGRKIAVGYAGHLWSHGTTYRGKNQDKLDDFENLMWGEENWEESARRLGVKYLYWGSPEEDKYPGSDKPWIGKLPVAARADDFVIYEFPSR